MAPTSTTLEVRDRILDYLRAEYPMPVTTKAVQTATAGTTAVRAYPGIVYPQLLALAAAGDVERVNRDDHRAAYWRYVPDPETANA